MDKIPDQQITQLLHQVNDGDQQALNNLLSLVYTEVKKIASKYLGNEYQKRTIQTTELAHEAYLRLVGPKNLSLENRKHFFGSIANAMRQILVDNARQRNAVKRFNGETKISLDKAAYISLEPDEELIVLNDALIKLDSFDNRLSKVVEMRFFIGLTVEETAEILSLSPTTVKRDWRLAKAWLHREIEKED